MKAKVESISPTPNIPTARIPSINLSRQFELESDDEDDYDPEIGGGGGGGKKREPERSRRIRRGVEIGMSVVMAGWATGWFFLALLRSS